DVVHRHRQCRVVAQHHHAQRVADEQHRHARLVEDARHRVVICGEHRDALATRLHLLNLIRGDTSHAALLLASTDAGRSYYLRAVSARSGVLRSIVYNATHTRARKYNTFACGTMRRAGIMAASHSTRSDYARRSGASGS